MKPYTDDEIMAMVENATHTDCALIASENAEAGEDEAELTKELYSFVLGDNESERAFQIFKDDCLNKQTERAIYQAGY